jgi:hypothetical protein
VSPVEVSHPVVPELKSVPGIKRASNDALADTAGMRTNDEARSEMVSKRELRLFGFLEVDVFTILFPYLYLLLSAATRAI